MNRKAIAFLSYVNLDDQHDQGRLTQFRERLSGEVRIQTGESFDIFQDRKDIAWGQQWQERLDTSLAAVTFLLPIITPAFFKSDACRAELERFLKREKELGRGDLILPVYYLTCPVLTDKEKLEHDPLAQIIAARQYADWRPLRFKPFDSEQVGEALAKMAQQIVAALERSRDECSGANAAREAGAAKETSSSKRSEKASKEFASQSNTFQSGGGPQSAAMGNNPIGTQNNYYGPQAVPPDKPPPRSTLCKTVAVGAFISTALFAATRYPAQPVRRTDTAAMQPPAPAASAPTVVTLKAAEPAKPDTAQAPPPAPSAPATANNESAKPVEEAAVVEEAAAPDSATASGSTVAQPPAEPANQVEAEMPSSSGPAPAVSNDILVQNTYAAFAKIPGITPEELEEGKNIIKGMNYNAQRAVRRLSVLPGASFALMKPLLTDLATNKLSFEQLLAFEQWSDLSGATMAQAAELLPGLRAMRREALKTFRACVSMIGIDASLALRLIPQLNAMNDDNSLTARQLFAIRGMDVRRGLDSLATLQKFNRKQAWAIAALAAVPDMIPDIAIASMPLVYAMREEDAWNFQYFIKRAKPDRNTAWTWLTRYFSQPLPVQESMHYSMSAQNRSALLDALYYASDEIIWKINNLHTVTNEYGVEYSQAQLEEMSVEQLQGLFDKLSPTTRANYGEHFAKARKADKGKMINALRQATTADRSQVGKDLTSANIYALLAQGSELYDTSFRDILVPILKARISAMHRDNLLVFLNATDPGNVLVFRFISSLAIKGKLMDFLPNDETEQQRVLDLVAKSAFKNEGSILLFSATFRDLLAMLKPSARHFLIQKLVAHEMVAEDNGKGSFSKLITVILQHYIQEYQELLSPESTALIKQIIARNGVVDIRRYLGTPFAQWKEDGQLGSLSLFYPDNDGSTSFISNAQLLSKNGYKLILSEQYSFPANTAERQRFETIIAQTDSNFAGLFEAMRQESFTAAFVKKVNGITIRHAMHVSDDSDDQESQQRVMLRFLKGGDEMLTQYDPYWRSKQITDPIKKLKESKLITEQDLMAKQRFLSLGSCDGLKDYTKLNRLFLGRVDIMATIGTGMAMINDPYSLHFFEIVANSTSSMNWEDLARKTAFIFSGGRGQDYLQPGCLTAILHKILDEDMKRQGIKPKDEEEEISSASETL